MFAVISQMLDKLVQLNSFNLVNFTIKKTYLYLRDSPLIQPLFNVSSHSAISDVHDGRGLFQTTSFQLLFPDKYLVQV